MKEITSVIKTQQDALCFSTKKNLYQLHNVNVLMFMITLLFLSSYTYFLLGWIKQKRRNKLEKIQACLNIICIFNTMSRFVFRF